MSLEIIIGKNKTGKTKYLETKYKQNIKDSEFLFIQAEIDFDKVLKGNEGGTGRNEIPSPHKKIIDFLNNIIGKSFNVKINDEDYKKILEKKNDIDKFNDKIKNTNDDFFEDCFRNCLDTSILSQEFVYEFQLIKYNKLNRIGSSGSLNYSLIKLLYEMIMNDKIQIQDKFTLVIDEVEKFLHPELIFKIAHMIVNISKKIDVILTTHSPIFLEQIFYLHKKIIKNKNKIDIKYSLKYKYDDNDQTNGIFTLDNGKICNFLNEKNYRTISNFSKFLFSSKCFFVEGLIDYTIINEIISSLDLNIPYMIIDFGNKDQVKLMFKVARELSIIQFFNICLFYDTDSNKNNKKEDGIIEIKDNEKQYVSSIENDPDIEQSLFEVKKENKEKPNKVTSIIIKNNKCIKVEDFKKEKDFYFGINWILENTTKQEKDVKKTINNWKQKIKEFLEKN